MVAISFIIYFIISAFTQEQFDYVLSRTIPVSISIGIISLAFTIVNALVTSLLAIKGIQNKILATFVTSLYTAAVCFIFAISIVRMYLLLLCVTVYVI